LTGLHRITRLLGAILVIGLAGCGASSSAASLTTVTINMGYVPDIQFAPFYVAVEKGYYRKAGLNVRFDYSIEPNALKLLAEGRDQFVDSGGDEVLDAGAQGLPVRYVMTQYSRFPTAIFWLKSSHITGPQSLRGKTIGLPGLYGASYVGLLAYLHSVGIPQSAVQLRSIGFNQVPAVANGKVDAAVGYAINEPVELQAQGRQVGEIDVYHRVNIAGAGIATSLSEMKKHPAIVRAFVQATIHGMRDTIADPAQAFNLSTKEIKGLSAQRKTQLLVLKRADLYMRAEKGHALGWVDPTVWSVTEKALLRYGQIKHSVTAASYYTNRFIPGS